MFASIISGALISLVLFYLAPLPLMVAGLGWGPLSATIGGIVAALGLGAVFGMPYCLAFVLTIALPAWWLGHLALLGRPIATGHVGGKRGRACSTRHGMVPGRPHPAVDRRFCRADHHGGAVHARRRCRGHHRRAAPRTAADHRHTRPGRRRHRSDRRCAGDDRPGRGRHCRNDDAHAQSLAGRENHRDLRPVAPPMAPISKARRCRR